MYSLRTRTPEESRKLGEWLGRRLRAGDFVALIGDLGTGKTHLCRAVLAGLGVERSGGSPTFTLLWEYQGRTPVCHWDVYRLDDPEEMESLGYEEYFFGDFVNLVEWADKIRSIWPEEYLSVELFYGEGEHERRLQFSGSPRHNRLLEELQHADFGT